jgi:hypothetical protein
LNKQESAIAAVPVAAAEMPQRGLCIDAMQLAADKEKQVIKLHNIGTSPVQYFIAVAL